MVIGTVVIEKGLALAPMAGVADRAFREICREFGADYTVSEMVSAKALSYGDKKTKQLMELGEGEHPSAIQLFGSDPSCMEEAAGLSMEYRPDILDINMGCPTPKIVRSGDGSALMKKPELIFDLVRAAVRASAVPVTVKLRSGWDAEHKNAVECALAAQEGGASALAVHGKTRSQFYAPPVELDAIAQVVQAVSIPVFGNGEISSVESAERMKRETGCQGLMIGRGALGNPFLFRQLKQYFEDGSVLPPPTAQERMETALCQLERMARYKGERPAMLEARRHFGWYLKGLRGASKLKARAFQIVTVAQARQLASEISALNRDESFD